MSIKSRSGQYPDFTECFPPRCHRLYRPLSPDAYRASPSRGKVKHTRLALAQRTRRVMAFFFFINPRHKLQCFHNRDQRRSHGKLRNTGSSSNCNVKKNQN